MTTSNTDIPKGPGSVDHQKMTIWAPPGDNCAPALDALSSRFELKVLRSLTDIDPDAGPVLFLYAAPARRIYNALQQGQAPSLALQEWREQTEAILRLNRRNRRQVRLLEITMIGRHPQAFLDHFDLPQDPAQDPGLLKSLATLVPDAVDKMLYLLAQHSLNGDPAARELCEELEVAALDFSGGADVVSDDPDQIFVAYNTARQVQEDVAALQVQNQHMQRDIETLTNSNTGLEQDKKKLSLQVATLKTGETQFRQRLDQLNQGLESSQNELSDAHQQVDLMQTQNRVVHDELDAVQKDNLRQARQIETLTQDNQRQKDDIAALHTRNAGLMARATDKDRAIQTAGTMLRDLEAHITDLRTSIAKTGKVSEQNQSRAATLEAELQRITGSKSFRLTAPLRRLRGLISGRE